MLEAVVKIQVSKHDVLCNSWSQQSVCTHSHYLICTNVGIFFLRGWIGPETISFWNGEVIPWRQSQMLWKEWGRKRTSRTSLFSNSGGFCANSSLFSAGHSGSPWCCGTGRPMSGKYKHKSEPGCLAATCVSPEVCARTSLREHSKCFHPQPNDTRKLWLNNALQKCNWQLT